MSSWSDTYDICNWASGVHIRKATHIVLQLTLSHLTSKGVTVVLNKMYNNHSSAGRLQLSIGMHVHSFAKTSTGMYVVMTPEN